MNEQKTENTHGAMELNLNQRDLTTVTAFAWDMGRTNDPSFQPFKTATWQRMRTLLGRIIKRADQQNLWDAANPPTQQLGSHEFRRLQMADIDVLAGPNKDAMMRALGATPIVLHKHYKSDTNQSYQRTLQWREKLNSLSRVEGEDGNASSSSEDLLAGYDPSADYSTASSDSESTSFNPPPVPASRAKKTSN